MKFMFLLFNMSVPCGFHSGYEHNHYHCLWWREPDKSLSHMELWLDEENDSAKNYL